jgi:hypothetical protein
MRALLLCLLLCACKSAPERLPPQPLTDAALHPRSTLSTQPEPSYVEALREEYRALGRVQAVLGWYSSTQGEPSLTQLTYLGHDRLFNQQALETVDKALSNAGVEGNDRLALRFFRRSLTGEIVSLSVAKFDDEYTDTEAGATVTLPWREKPVSYRDLSNLIAQEPDPARRQQAFAAMTQVMTSLLNPILEKKEEAAQKTARETGFADYVALSEDLRGVRLGELLAQGVAYLRATDKTFMALLDRIAREELGIPREKLRTADMSRLFKAPKLAPYFDKSFELKALRRFLSGIGLDLGAVQVDDSLHPKKRPRAFVNPVDAPADVRLSVKPSGGLDDYWTLFHEAGHAVHFASATILPKELVNLGHGAPSEAFGEFFRHAFSDPRWLVRYRAFLGEEKQPQPSNQELAAVLRRTALVEMYYLRRYAFAKIAYELRLHGRPAAEITPALAELPLEPGDLRELYRMLMSRAYGFELNDAESQRYRADVDDTFYSADYSRAFVLAGMMHDAIRRRFGEDWYANKEVGAFLRKELFSQGTALSAEDVAVRLGFPARLDFAGAAARASRLAADADALEK